VEGNAPPSLTFLEPNGINDVTDQSFTIRWVDEDPEENALISLYYDNDGNIDNGQTPLSASSIYENDPLDQYVWNTTNIPNGQYYIRAYISDGVNTVAPIQVPTPIIVDHTPSAPYFENPYSVEFSSGGHLEIADANQTGLDLTGDLTLELWINLNSYPVSSSNTAQYGLISKWHGPDEAFRFLFKMIGGNQQAFTFRMDDGIEEIDLRWDMNNVPLHNGRTL